MPKTLRDLTVGDAVDRFVVDAFGHTHWLMTLTITACSPTGLASGEWLFDRATGMEVDPVLEWGPEFGRTGTFIRPATIT